MGLRAKAAPEVLTSLAGWGLELSEAQWTLIHDYARDVEEANKRMNLTAEADPSLVLRRHIADGLAAVAPLQALLARVPRPRLLDLGSGAGFIGVPIKIAWPQARVTLMESDSRKFSFLNGAAARCGLKDLRVLKLAAGQGHVRERYDAVLERAVAPLPEALALGLSLTEPGGFFIAYQSRPPDPGEPPLKKCLDLLGASLCRSVPYRLPRERHDRYLAVFQRGD